MTFHLPDHKLSYIAVPKSACTSLKQFFFEIQNGFAFRPFTVNGRRFHIHTLAPSVPFEALPRARIKDHARIAVVREPVSRITSCYANKVLGERLLEKPQAAAHLADSALTTRPTIAEFVENLRVYQAASSGILHHSQPLSHFLGPDPAYYARLFRMPELPDLVNFVADHVGEVPALPHSQRSRSAKVRTEVTPDLRNRIEELFAEDLELFGNWM